MIFTAGMRRNHGSRAKSSTRAGVVRGRWWVLGIHEAQIWASDEEVEGLHHRGTEGHRVTRRNPASAATASGFLQTAVSDAPRTTWRTYLRSVIGRIRYSNSVSGQSIDVDSSVATSAFDRHRGGGHPPTPATPPCVRVRTRRFELVTLAFIDQRWKSKRFEVSIGKPHREGFGPSQIPRAESATGRVVGQSRANPEC